MRIALALLGCVALNACAGKEPTGTEQQPGCEGRGDAFVLGMSRESEDGLVRALLTEATPVPPLQGMNSWTVEVSQDGSPVIDAREPDPEDPEDPGDSQVIATIVMVEHAHDVSKVVSMTAPGVFDIPFSLTMSGYWEVTLEVWPDKPANDDDHEDTVFGFCVRN